MANEVLKLRDLKATAKTQARHEINPDALADYKQTAKDTKAKGADAPFPPLVAYRDMEGNVWLADGFTRRAALLAAGYDEFAVDVRDGTKREALQYAFKANQEHGARLTNKDKQHNLKLALEDKEWAELSNNALADLLGVSEAFIRQNRPVAKKPKAAKTKKGTTMNTEGIGRKGGDKRKKARATKKKSGPAPDAGGGGDAGGETPDAAKQDDALVAALAKIAKAINGHGFNGEEFIGAVQSGALPVSAPEVKKWSGLSEARILLIAPLVITNRWSVAKAVSFVDKEITGDTKADHFINLAVAHGGLVREVVGNAKCIWIVGEGYTIGESKDGTITITPPKKAPKK